MSTQLFFDAYYVGYTENRQSQTEIFLFHNRTPMIWLNKRQNLLEVSKFGSKFIAMDNSVDTIKKL